ncbi:MAG: HD domain-containing protein [Polyangiaceae bacterium]|nr:HD domain-containing protein [Polyangiaceae bacterium]
MDPAVSVIGDLVPPTVGRLCRTLGRAGFRSWPVGGAVRDVLLALMTGGDPKAAAASCDWDIATTAHPDQVRSLFKRVVATGIAHGTVTVLLDGVGYEVTTLRGEARYSDGRHPDSVSYVDDIRADLARRDFTVNAIAYDPESGKIEDPFGGLDDLRSRVLRAVGDPAQRFAEDGLRVLRAARFVATLELTLEPQTRKAIRASLGSYRQVSAERIRDEWMKAFRAREPSRAFRIMQEHGLLEITAPELLAMVGCRQNRFHAYDVWEHTMRTLDACPPKPLLRLAALLHDAGKPASRAFNHDKGDYTFYEHERLSRDVASALLPRLRFSKEECSRVEALVSHHIVAYDGSWSDAAVRRWMRRVSPELVADVLELSRADVRAKGSDATAELERLDELERRVAGVIADCSALSVRELSVNGHDLMRELGLPPGPELGRILRELLELVTEEPALNQRDALLERARRAVGSADQRPEPDAPIEADRSG